MNIKKKILFSIGAMGMVATLVCVAVFAFPSQSPSSGYYLAYKAINSVDATLVVSAKYLKSDGTESDTIDLDTSTSATSLTINISSIDSSSGTTTLPKTAFRVDDSDESDITVDKIQYTFIITNTGTSERASNYPFKIAYDRTKFYTEDDCSVASVYAVETKVVTTSGSSSTLTTGGISEGSAVWGGSETAVPVGSYAKITITLSVVDTSQKIDEFTASFKFILESIISQ